MLLSAQKATFGLPKCNLSSHTHTHTGRHGDRALMFGLIRRRHSKWNYHWSLVSNGDFSKLNRSDAAADDDHDKPKIRFKIIPPPPKAKPQAPPPPPPPKRAPPPKRPRPKRRVEVDVFRLCWKESWMSLKPPRYLYLKAKEPKIKMAGFTAIAAARAGRSKPALEPSGAEWAWPAHTWTRCWEQVETSMLLSRSNTKPQASGAVRRLVAKSGTALASTGCLTYLATPHSRGCQLGCQRRSLIGENPEF